ncbi:hypothetical protein C8R46DRAFT_1220411 [Mycena filopes]|nr:hypothetical protein C8R46DRAFT_1220411 [Mycena filopes]
MRRALRYLDWEQRRWGALKAENATRTDITGELRHGLEVYATKQVTWHRDMAMLFREEMGHPLEKATALAIASGVEENDEVIPHSPGMARVSVSSSSATKNNHRY